MLHFRRGVIVLPQRTKTTEYLASPKREQLREQSSFSIIFCASCEGNRGEKIDARRRHLELLLTNNDG